MKPVLPGTGATDYERYLNVPLLLSAKKPESELVHREEHLFQITHQTAELWFDQILFDLKEVERDIDRDAPLPAARLLRRSSMIVKIVTEQVHVLETMLVWDYHTIRTALGRGSGAESPGFTAILAYAPKLYGSFARLLDRRKTNLDEINVHVAEHFDLVELADALVDFDMYFHIWRQNHLAFVKRIIGPGVRSLKGYSVHDLEKHIANAFFFPELLDGRDRLTERAGLNPQHAP
ncbi:MAG: tryptophan 2,3-dioxygenase family protein [Thermoplasmatota archaeon]